MDTVEVAQRRLTKLWGERQAIVDAARRVGRLGFTGAEQARLAALDAEYVTLAVQISVAAAQAAARRIREQTVGQGNA